ncbi:response regulator [bacterium]|nr:response regulator [candidate division CSSED10-310 bacterium]
MKTIVVADDDVRIRELLQFIIEGMSCRVILCEDGREVLKILKNNPVDLLLMDILMPHMNGFEAYGKIRAMNKFAMLPIVLVTGVYDYARIKAEIGTKDRHYSILFKPISVKRVQNLIERHIGEEGNVEFIFPGSVKNHPSFKMRLTVDPVPSELMDRYDRHRFFVPRKGAVAAVRPGHILHFAVNFGGNWIYEIESDAFQAGVTVQEGYITGYRSNNENHMRDAGFLDKVPFLSRQRNRSWKSCQHSWVTGKQASTFSNFLFDLLTASDGQYCLREFEAGGEDWKPVKPQSLNKLLLQFALGEFPPETCRKIISPDVESIHVADHYRLFKADFEWPDEYLEIMKEIRKYPEFREWKEHSSIEINRAFNLLTALYHLGGIAIHCRQNIKPFRMPVPEKNPAKTDIPAETRHTERKTDIADLVKRKFQAGYKGLYYDFLEIPPTVSDSALIKKMNELESELKLWEADRDLDPEMKRQVLATHCFLKEAKSLFSGRSDRAEYDALLKLTNAADREIAASEQNKKGKKLIGEGKTVMGIAHLKLAILMNPQSEQDQELLLGTLSPLSAYSAVTLKHALACLRMFPDNINIHVVLGQCYEKIGMRDQAIAEFKRILEQEPSNLEALQFLLQFPDQEKEIFGL